VPRQPSSPRGRARRRRTRRTGTRQQACGTSRPVRKGFSQLPRGQQHLGTPLQQRAALSRPPPDEERPEMISTTCKLTCTHSPIVAVTKAAASPNLSRGAAPRGSAGSCRPPGRPLSVRSHPFWLCPAIY
jgi:hypothetical protein